MPYDESHIHSSLSRLSPQGQVAFAAACAEWLFPSYQEFVRVSGTGDVTQLRDALDTAWKLADGQLVGRAELEQRRAAVEQLVPNDDAGDWSVLSPIAQNACAATAYAIRVWLAGDPQEAVWAARQLYEAADYMVQLEAAAHEYVDGASNLNDPLSVVVEGITGALAIAGTQMSRTVRDTATADGQQLLTFWRPEPE